MRKTRLVLASILLLALIAGLRAAARNNPTPAAAEPYDTVITGGRVVDGTGNPWFSADVGIRDGRVAAIGALCAPAHGSCPARRTIDASGLYVTPGFIDMLGQ